MAGGVVGSLMYAVGFRFNSKGLDKADSKVAKLTKGVFGMSAALGAAAIGIGAAALASAGKFETAMNQMQQATGMTAQQLEATKGIVKDLYAQNYGESWDDLGQSIASVTQITGMTGTALEGATKNALALRNAFGFEVSESIRTVDTMIKNFGITSDQAFNLIAQGKQKGLDFSGEMLDSLNEYSNQFVSLGFSANQMFDTLAAGAASGAFNLDKVGDAVKEFNLRASDQSKTTIQAYKALGMNANQMMATFAAGGPAAQKAFSQVIQSISAVKDPVKANIIATNLFGTQFEDLQENVLTAMGSVRSQFDMTQSSMTALNTTKFTSIGQVLGFLGRQVETYVLIPIGQKLIPYLNRFGQWITGHKPEIIAFGQAIADGMGAAINKVSGWIQTAMPYVQQFGVRAGAAIGQLIDKGKELWSSLQPVVVTIGQGLLGAARELWPEIQAIAVKMYEVSKAITSWSGFLPVVAGITAAVVAYKVVVGLTTLATSAWTIVTKLQAMWTNRATIAQTALNVVMSLNPIGLVVAALAALVVGFMVAYKRSDKFRKVIDKTWSGIKTAAMATVNFFRITIPKWFMAGFNAATSILKKWGPLFLAVLAGPLGLVVGLVIKHWDKVKAVTVQVFTAIWTWLKSAWRWLINTTIQGAVAIWAAIKNGWNKMNTSTRAAFTTVMDTVKGAWNKVLSTTGSLLTRIWSKITGIWDSIVSGVKTAGNNLWSAVKEMWGKVTGVFDGINLFEIGENVIQSLIDGVNSMASTLISKVESMGKNFMTSVKRTFGFRATANVSVDTDAVLGNGGVDGVHKNGLSYVPWDGYIAKLHKGERVLTAEENEQYPRFTPEAAPARVTGTKSRPVTVSPVININVEGNADSKTVSSLRTTIQDEVLEIILSALRSSGLEGA